MNDVGLTLAWLFVQVAIFLTPAMVLNVLASRRGPAAGAWVAVLSLGFVVVLNVAAFVPRVRWNDKTPVSEFAQPAIARENNTAQNAASSFLGPEVIQPAARPSRTPDWLGLAWDRLGRGAAEPAVRVRPRASTLAAVALAGTAAGLFRLTIGLYAVARSCRRGRRVDDPGLTGLPRGTAMGDGVSPARGNPRGARPGHTSHGGPAPAGALAPGRLANMVHRRASGGPCARAGSYCPR